MLILISIYLNIIYLLNIMENNIILTEYILEEKYQILKDNRNEMNLLENTVKETVLDYQKFLILRKILRK